MTVDTFSLIDSIAEVDAVLQQGGKRRKSRSRKSRRGSRKRGRSVRGSRSKTHPGDLNYTTKRGDKDFHRRGHNVRLSRRPYTKKSRKRRGRGRSRRYNKIKMNSLLRAALPFRPKSRRRSRNRARGERIKYRVRSTSKHMKDALSR